MVAADPLPLAGQAAPRRPTDRLFFALFPSPDTAAAIASVAQQVRGEFGLTGQPLPVERLHVTLHFLGDHTGLPQDVVASAQAAASRVARSPFELCFDRVASFASHIRRKPCVLLSSERGLEPLRAFRRQLGDVLQRAGLGRWHVVPFTPHVTLLYDDRAVPEHRVAPICWTAHELVLVHSLIGRARYTALGRWPISLAEATR